MNTKPAIGIFGAGWVGLVTGACFADLGHEVVVRDIVPERIDLLNRGELPFYEEGLAELIENNRERLTFTLEAGELTEKTDLFFVCVDTPPTPSGDADLSSVWSVIDHIGDPGEAILIMKSTVPVGTGDRIRANLDERGLRHVGYVSNPEFLAEGRAVKDFMNPDRVVVGAFDEAHGDRVAALYENFDAPIVHMSVPSAEMVKLAANAFLATRISFINEIANVSEAVGADVEDVAKGVGLDHRLGPHFLRAGIGFGGSCLAGDETVVVRAAGRTRLVSLEDLFAELSADGPPDAEIAWPDDVEVLAWDDERDELAFFALEAATRRAWGRELCEVRTKMGRRVRCTPDHPFLTSPGTGTRFVRKLASDLGPGDWLPLAQAPATDGFRPGEDIDVLDGMTAADLAPEGILVRPAATESSLLTPTNVRAALERLGHRRARPRSYEISYSGALRLHEARELDLVLEGATFGTSRNGHFVPSSISDDEEFWYVVGLYVAEGHATAQGKTHRLTWSFHPSNEESLVETVLRYWRRRGIPARRAQAPTAANVIVASRLLVGWWRGELGLGSNCYEQHVPDRLWSAPESHKRAFLAGMWRGDGSWSYVRGGPSVILEYGTASRELADGALRLLGEFGIASSLRVGRTAKSRVDTYWIRVSGANQVERLLGLVAPAARPEIRASLRRQAKRIAPTGYRIVSDSVSALRVREVAPAPRADYVYSLEVASVHNFVTTGGLIVSNCFPKDVSFLKLLAGNSGYHFQLVNAVIEVNELQKRRVVQKLKDHLGSLRGKTIALLGLAFKPNTDDMREAPSIVLASRLQAEGAEVHGWDPFVRGHPSLDGVVVHETVLDAVRGADAAVIVTEWDELSTLASDEVREAMRNPLIVDGRNLLDPAATRAAGFAYEGIGRS